MLVFPVAKEIVIINNDNPSKIVDLVSIPKLILIPVTTDVIAITGMLSPILAKAEPKAKFKDV